ncbi:PK2L2 protein, partial [Zapornia atra]|nr:PK2L2 protein [Zapornia atra]
GAANHGVSCSSEKEMKATLRELVIYIVFLTDLCILTFGRVNSEMYHLNKVMARLFLDPYPEYAGSGFQGIRSRADFWRFAEGPLLDGLFWDKWYSNMTETLQNNDSHIYYENLLLGVAQIRQLKVRNNTCSIYPYFQSLLEGCYSEYRYQAEDTADFGLMNDSEWKYTSASSLSPWYWGSMGFYSSGGYVFTLPKSKQKSAEKLEFLRENNWLTRGTRAVFTDFSTYNANINLFCVIRLVVEFPATGGAITSSHTYSVKLLRYVTSSDYFLASCEAVFCLFIITFAIQEVRKIVKLKKAYFTSTWNCLELLLVVTSLLAIAFNAYRTVKVSLLLKELLSDATVYPDFYFLAYWQVLYNNMIAVNIFFAWIKVFKYISFNKTMMQLSSTLSRCAKDILGFAIMFFIIFFAYAQLGYLVFGAKVEEFSSLQNCIFTQFCIVLGDFNFEAIKTANRILGPIYFVTFVFFVFFILLNIFLAIINDTYSEVKADFEVTPSQELQIRKFFSQSCKKALVNLKLKKPEPDRGTADKSLGRKGFSAVRRKDAPQLSNRHNADKKSHVTPSKLLTWNYSPAEDATTAQSYVTTAEFQQLLRHMDTLEKEIIRIKAKLMRTVRTMEMLKEAVSKTTQ